VWEVLADIGNIHVWNPGVVDSKKTNERNGLGGSRHCDIGGKNYLEEDVVDWQEGEKLTMRIMESNLPFKRADIHFFLESDGNQTIVKVAPDYELKFGLLGRVMDSLMVRRTYQKGMETLLAGLKSHIES